MKIRATCVVIILLLVLLLVSCRSFTSAASLNMIRNARPVFLEPRTQPVNREPRADLDGYLGPAGATPVDLKAIEDNPDLLLPWSEAAPDLMAVMEDVWEFLDKVYLSCEVNITHMSEKVRELKGQIRQAKAVKASLRAADWRRVARVPPTTPPLSSIGSHSITNYHISSCSSTSVTIVRCPNYSLANTKNTSG